MKTKWKLTLTIIFSLTLFFFSFNVSTSFAKDWKINKIISGNVNPSYLQLVSAKNEYGLVWEDNREADLELYFSRINNSGVKIGQEIKLTDDTEHDETPALVWNGKDYALFWSHSRSQIYFTQFKENGKKIIDNKSLEVHSKGYAIHVSAVWNGEEYGVVWWDVRDAPACNPPGTRGRAFFARVDKDGNMIGEEIPVSDAFSNPWQDYHPLMVWDGENYAIFWNDSREGGECTGGVGDGNIYMAKVSRNGEKILGDIKLQSNEPSPQLWDIEWDGVNYVIGYNGRIAQGHLAKMDTNGNTILVDLPINSDNQGGSPMISAYDDKYYIAWSDFRDRTPETFYNTEIYYTITDKNGNKLIPETRITYQDDSQARNTKITFIKKSKGIAWLDLRSGLPEVYFASESNYKIPLPSFTFQILPTIPTPPSSPSAPPIPSMLPFPTF